MGRLTGKVAIITGAGQGIGRGMAFSLAKEGASVVLGGRTESKVKQVAEELKALSLNAIALKCDVTVRADVNRLVETAVEKFGAVDSMFNNAFSGNNWMSVEDTPDEYMLGAIQTNIFGTLYGMQACLPHMKKNGGGSIINFGSGAGIQAFNQLLSYATTKEGIRAMTRVAAREWGPHKIRVNVMCPAAMSPAMIEYENNHPEPIAALKAMTPLGYIGDCEDDIGPVAVFLASDDSKYMTGHTFMVDGGCFMII